MPAESPETLTEALVRRSEEHTSELQSPCNIVCRLLLEKKKYGVGAAGTVRTAQTRSELSDEKRQGEQSSPQDEVEAEVEDEVADEAEDEDLDLDLDQDL